MKSVLEVEVVPIWFIKKWAKENCEERHRNGNI